MRMPGNHHPPSMVRFLYKVSCEGNWLLIMKILYGDKLPKCFPSTRCSNQIFFLDQEQSATLGSPQLNLRHQNLLLFWKCRCSKLNHKTKLRNDWPLFVALIIKLLFPVYSVHANLSNLIPFIRSSMYRVSFDITRE